MTVSAIAGGSATMPEGNIKMELHQGQMGITYLSEAIAEATLDDQQRLAFKCHLVPSAGGRPSGHVFMSGSVPVVLDWMPAVQVGCGTP